MQHTQSHFPAQGECYSGSTTIGRGGRGEWYSFVACLKSFDREAGALIVPDSYNENRRLSRLIGVHGGGIFRGA